MKIPNKILLIIISFLIVLVAMLVVYILNSEQSEKGDTSEVNKIKGAEEHNIKYTDNIEEIFEAEEIEIIELEPSHFHIALGDSVATGFGVAYEERYTFTFYQWLKEEGHVNDYINMATNGNTSTMVLEHLNSLNEEELSYFQEAYIITLNIGGNNVLVPLLDYIPTFEEIIDAILEVGTIASDSIGVFSDTRELASDVMDIIENFSILDILRIREFLERIPETLNDSIDIFNRITSLELGNPIPFLFGTFPDELEAELDKGVNDFSIEFKEIINWLNKNAPNAIIIVNTIYNPVPKEILGIHLELFDKAEVFTKSINDIIHENQGDKEYLISDVSSRFENELNVIDVMNFNLDLSTLNFNFDIVHPNSEGHGIIAELNREAYIAS
ncbi:MAG: SGNH/GDSL hydrolase family protein [Oscillospiraceae bacterium]|jgi:lysophospholipase L1-like esterase|nr:SGNH/GDSL hydrolase family protein [Oscillospiraceae bacterium]